LEIIAVYNIKGGVGKTTTAVNLAYLSADAGWPTVLWDLDPQAAATFLLGADAQSGGALKKLVRGQRTLPDLVVGTRFANLDLIPAHFSYRRMDAELSERSKRAKVLLKLMRPLRSDYAAMFLDCPPGISLVSENIMRAADALVIPLIPTPLSLRTLEELFEFLEREKWGDLEVLPFFSMVDRRRVLHSEFIATARARWPQVLATEIPYNSDIERMACHRAPLPWYAAKNRLSKLYRTLWDEIDVRLQHRVRSHTPAQSP
jgi:chromosome partitioning protein